MANDPVSGNPIPPGGTAEGVRDDVPLMASEGEYIIPANVVNFLGVEKLEKMVLKAKEQLAEMDKAKEPDLTLEGEPLVNQGVTETVPAQNMAEGGPVTKLEDILPQDQGFTGIKQFKDKDGNIFYVPYQNGKAFIDIPSDATPVDEMAVTDEAPNPEANVYGTDPAMTQSRNDPSPNEMVKGQSPLAKSPEEWAFEDFITYADNKDSAGNKAMEALIRGAFGPLGQMAISAQNKYRNPIIAEGFDKMLSDNTDLQGNPLTAEQRQELVRVTDGIKNEVSEKSGLELRGLPSVKTAVDKFLNFVGGRDRNTEATSAPRDSTGMTGWAGSTSDDQYSGSLTPGNRTMGSDLGRDPDEGPSEGSVASGGLY